MQPKPENSNRLYASLILTGKDLIPHNITDSLGITPTKSFKRGDTRKGEIVWPHGYWEIETSSHVNSSDPSAHLEWLVEQVYPEKSRLQEILLDKRIDALISCFWISPYTQIGMSIEVRLLRKIADLGVRLEFDFHCP